MKNFLRNRMRLGQGSTGIGRVTLVLNLPLSLLLSLVDTSGTFADEVEDEAALISDPLPAPITEAGFRNTHYYLILESDYVGQARTEKLLDPSGKTVAKVSAKFRKDLLMEGSGKLEDGRVLNYAGKVGGVSRFAETVHEWGRGSGDCPLRPFKTIAVDRAQIPSGTVVYIDETAGMLLPDGNRHNGVWYAEDTGGAILRDRIDFFVGTRRQGRALAENGIDHLQAMTIRALQAPAADSCTRKSPR